MLRDRRFKLIDAPRPELYDLQNDPLEGHDLAREKSAVARAMQDGLRAMLVDPGDRRGERAQDYLANRESLAALGYVSGPPRSPRSPAVIRRTPSTNTTPSPDGER